MNVTFILENIQKVNKNKDLNLVNTHCFLTKYIFSKKLHSLLCSIPFQETRLSHATDYPGMATLEKSRQSHDASPVVGMSIAIK